MGGKTGVTPLTKIVFAGLANAGKSSIIITIDQEMEKLEGLKPTQGIETSTFSFLGIPFFRWDLGGQKKYIKRYVQNAERYFAETGLLIYIIDVQDLVEQTVKETMQYLKDIRSVFKKLKELPPIVIFFHKYDPDLKDRAVVDGKIEEIKAQCDKLFSNTDLFFDKTSVKDPDRLRKVFIDAVKICYPKARVLDRILDDLAGQFGIPIQYLYDYRQIQVAQYLEEGTGFDAINRFNQVAKPLVEKFRDKTGADAPTDPIVTEFEPGLSLVVKPFEHSKELYLLVAAIPNGIAQIDDALENCTENSIREITKVLRMFG